MPIDPQSYPPLPRPGILEIAPYVGGKATVSGVENVVKLSSNETPLGPSPLALAAAQLDAKSLAKYPDGNASELRAAIAQHHSIDADRIVCGTGSDNLLELLIRAYVGPGDEVVYSEHGFLMYSIYTKGCGGTPVKAPEQNLTTHVDSLLAAVTPRTKMVFIANPNNPTGTYIPVSEVTRLRDGLPKGVILVLDCAYAEFMEHGDYTNGFALTDSADQNVVVTRTFSKIYGLAALRIGWAYCPENIADVLNRLRSPFNFTSNALAAGVAAINDVEHLAASRAHNTKWRSFLETELTALGLTCVPSFGNFVLVHFRDAEHAKAADQYLQQNGYIVRGVAAYGLPQCLRITVGLEQHCRDIVRLIAAFLEASSTSETTSAAESSGG